MALTDVLQIVSLTDPGRVRGHNEDCVESRPELGVVVLADGMGGYNAGEVASGMATSSISAGLADVWTPDALKGLDRAAAMTLSQTVVQQQAAKANAAIYAAAQKDPHCAGMGTTLVACLFYDNFLTVGHIGDSRLYRMRNDVLEQITRDHSLLQEQIDSGLISKEDARSSHNKNLVTRAVGIDPEVEAEVHSYDVQADDIFLLCSDGLNDMIEDEEIQMTLIALRSNLELTAQQLVQAANDAGGRDNVSVMLVRVVKSFEVERGFWATVKSWFR
ncbi:MAG: Stp1/IreP family PP2C-type Ser/Thr phosphatase [Burkholderiales bacterium]|nr:Stp1/IreP family PP2C-type Ser/Thr phosphatase [Burkholderiales bacterium]